VTTKTEMIIMDDEDEVFEPNERQKRLAGGILGRAHAMAKGQRHLSPGDARKVVEDGLRTLRQAFRGQPLLALGLAGELARDLLVMKGLGQEDIDPALEVAVRLAEELSPRNFE